MKTIIGPETHITGALSGKDDIEIHGAVDGGVNGEAAVTIAVGARIGGPVRGRDVVVAGELGHAVHATGLVRLLATAKLTGDIEAPRVAIDEGAVFEGQVRMRRAAPAAAAQPAAPVAQPAAPVAQPAVPAAQPAAPVVQPAAPVAQPAAPAPVTHAPAARPAPTTPAAQPPRPAAAARPAAPPAPKPALHQETAPPPARQIPTLATPGRKPLIRKTS